MAGDIKTTAIIPTFNRRPFLRHSLDSVLSQTRPADEIIVVDDGSSDDTQALIRQCYPTVRYLYQDNQGISAARNYGIRHAAGDWLAFLDSDDEWLPQKLEKQMSTLQQQPDYRVIHCNEHWLRNGSPKKQQAKHRKYGGYIFQRCLPLCVISPSAAVIHRSVFDRVGLFDTAMTVCEDYDMWLRITCRYPVLFVDEPLIVKHGGHADQLSQRYSGMDRFRIRAIKKVLEEDVLSFEDRKAAVAMLQEKITIYLNGARKYGNNEFIAEFEQLASQYGQEYTFF